tara:strand:+ start:4792 stop:6078 length:1287 start_codon:yes stop_codon:yes gene_type:complete
MNETTLLSTKDKFLSHFHNLDFSHDEPFSLKQRELASAQLKTLSFPDSKTEYWKYTRINKIINGEYKIAFPENELELDLAVPSKNCIVLINGFYSEAHSFTECEEGVRFSSLSDAKKNDPVLKSHFNSLVKEEEIFSVINSAFHQDGAVLHLGKNVHSEDPYYIFNFCDDSEILSNPRNFIYLEENSSAKVVLKTIDVNGGRCFTNLLTEVFVGRNANLEINKVQDDSVSDFQISNELVQQASNSVFKINTFTLNGALVRNNLNIDLLGQHTETHLNGLYPLKGKQHVDNHTYVYHREPNCESHELYKGILDDQSTGVFNGKVFVHREAQKTNAFQSNGNIVLTDQATINSKPELEIYADDVKCSHGSTIGQLDDEAMFYLRSRGLSKTSARAVLVNAFASDVIEQIGVEPIKAEIEAFIDKNYQGIK